MKTRRDYQKKQFKNPFFTKKSAKGGRNKFYFFVVILAVGVGLFFLSQSDFLNITEIKVAGNKTVLTQDIIELAQTQLAQKRFWFLNQNNILVFSKGQLREALVSRYFLDQVKVRKKIPHVLTIEVKEEIAPTLWASGQKKYYLDLVGRVVKEVDSEQLAVDSAGDGAEIIRFGSQDGSEPVIFDQSQSPVTIGQAVLDQSELDFIVGLVEAIENYRDFEISHFLISNPYAPYLTLLTTEGWQVHFRMGESLRSQFDKLKIILQQRVSDRSQLEYIDLRFGEKVFYK